MNASIPRKQTVAVIRFYNLIAGETCEDITEIPEDRLLVLADISYVELCRPFIVRDLEKGLSRKLLSERYGISESVIRTIGFHAGITSTPGSGS